jgi:hypothetical protein
MRYGRPSLLSWLATRTTLGGKRRCLGRRRHRCVQDRGRVLGFGHSSQNQHLLAEHRHPRRHHRRALRVGAHAVSVLGDGRSSPSRLVRRWCTLACAQLPALPARGPWPPSRGDGAHVSTRLAPMTACPKSPCGGVWREPSAAGPPVSIAINRVGGRIFITQIHVPVDDRHGTMTCATLCAHRNAVGEGKGGSPGLLAMRTAGVDSLGCMQDHDRKQRHCMVGFLI